MTSHHPCNHDVMTENRTVRLPDDLAADSEAVARVEGISVNEAVKQALVEAIERRRKDPKFGRTSADSCGRTRSCSHALAT